MPTIVAENISLKRWRRMTRPPTLRSSSAAEIVEMAGVSAMAFRHLMKHSAETMPAMATRPGVRARRHIDGCWGPDRHDGSIKIIHDEKQRH